MVVWLKAGIPLTRIGSKSTAPTFMFELNLCVTSKLAFQQWVSHSSENGLARPPPFPSIKFSSFLGPAMAWHPVSRRDIFPFISLSPSKQNWKKTTFAPIPGMEWVLDKVSHVQFLPEKNPSFLAYVLSVFSSPSAHDFHLWGSTITRHYSQLSLDGVSSKEIYNSAPGWIALSLRFKTCSQSQQPRLRLSELEEGPDRWQNTEFTQ